MVDGFPMTVTGKIRKVEMREQAVDLLAATDAQPGGPGRDDNPANDKNEPAPQAAITAKS